MTIIKECLQTLYELFYDLFKIFILVALFATVGISFPVDANAAENESGGIVVGRYVPQRSAVRPSTVPGQAIFVDTSPDDKVVNALSNNALSSLNELNEKDFASITTDNPAVQLNSQINVEGIGNISKQISGAGLAPNIMQATSGIGGVLKGSGGAISSSISRATSSIGHAITGATAGFPK